MFIFYLKFAGGISDANNISLTRPDLFWHILDVLKSQYIQYT